MIKKIHESIKLLTSNLGLFSAIIFTVWLPGSVLLVCLRLYVFPDMYGTDDIKMALQEMRVTQVIELMFGPIYVGAMLHALSQIKKGTQPSYRASMLHAGRRSFKLFTARLVCGFIIAAGCLAFIIPGIILALRFALIDAVVVLEGVEGAAARNFSAQYTQGKRWNIFGAMLVTFAGLIIAATIPSILLSLTGQEGKFVSEVIYECFSNFIFVLPNIVLFLFYWEAKNNSSIL